jgi:hypothetical protein
MKNQKNMERAFYIRVEQPKPMRTYHRLSAAPGFSLSARRSIFWRDILSDMNTARRAGGNKTAFTLAVVFVILLVIGGFVWRTFQGEPDPQPPPALQGKGNG